MPIDLNHTIVYARDKRTTAHWFADIMGLEVSPHYGPFLPVQTSNGVSLDFMEANGRPIAPQHYAFLVGDDEFDAILARLQQAGIPYYGGHGHQRPGRINHNDGGRGTYFDDPNGHVLEIITVPYGGPP